MAVDERLRGRGLGHWLAQAALDFAREEGLTAVYLLTETAHGFFLRFGFVPLGRDDVPAQVHESREFTNLCQASSLVMGLALERA